MLGLDGSNNQRVMDIVTSDNYVKKVNDDDNDVNILGNEEREQMGMEAEDDEVLQMMKDMWADKLTHTPTFF